MDREEKGGVKRTEHGIGEPSKNPGMCSFCPISWSSHSSLSMDKIAMFAIKHN